MMDLGKKTQTIKVAFPRVNALVFILSIVLMIIGLITNLFDHYTFLGIKVMFVLPFLSTAIGYVTFKGIFAYREGNHIELYEKGLRFKQFESTYDKLVVRRNGITETLTLDNGKEEAVFTGCISRADYVRLMSL